MEKQNEMIKARRKSRRKARFEESANVAKQLLEEAEANKASHTQAHQETKNKQEDLVCVLSSSQETWLIIFFYFYRLSVIHTEIP